MASGSTWSGLPEFNRRIAALNPAIKATMKAVLNKSADDLVALARRNVPVHTEAPHIRDTIRKERGRSELSIDISVGSSALEYAAPLEFGHMKGQTHVRGQPFFYPAATVIRKRHLTRMRRELAKTMRAIWNAGGVI